MTHREIVERIEQLKKEKNAVILAHYYTRPEVQDIADYLGDSLGLSREAAATDADIIVFCGVHFMAETASIISPNKKVLIPDQSAGCSLAESITGYDLKKWKEANPNGWVVSYVNTTAEVKAWSDVCCTSSNALDVVKNIPKDKNILFVPDTNLGHYIKKVTGRNMEIWSGDCCVHHQITGNVILKRSAQYPEADILIHPESHCSHNDEILAMPQSYMYSTAGMIKHAKESSKKQFIVATEIETIHKLQQDSPSKEFIPISSTTLCGQMKKITLEKVLQALESEHPQVQISNEYRERAWLPIQRMLEIK